jgi:redox-sensitive bicupin YhaK (pirin superfamily)
VIPNQMNVTPRYDQITIDQEKSKNTLQQILSPNKEDAVVWIHQDAWFHLGNFTKYSEFTYTLKKEGNGLYVFLLSGTLMVDTYTLSARDGIGITAFEQLNFKAGSDLSVLLMEVPMLKF